jgi:hypothetical protein
MTVYHAMCLVVVQSGWCCAQRPHGSGATQAAAIADLKSQLTANAMIQSVEIVRVNL